MSVKVMAWSVGCILFVMALMVFPRRFSEAGTTHLDKTKVKSGCNACHKGHGRRGTTLLSGSKDDLCLKCHDYSGKASNILGELTKSSNHRILETSRYHQPGEDLPETDPSRPRHASCYDCHNVHKSEKNRPLKGLRGYSGRGALSNEAERQFEVCYHCHSDSVNLRSEAKTMPRAFDPSNPSFHPVETYGRRITVPSIRGGAASRLIDCSDCHGNDNPAGPKGPHGSIYAPILRHQYIRNSGAESPQAYELCYSCHERTSILGDESFRAHKLHIVFNRVSCAQCHDAHGSRFYPALVKFDITTVFPNSNGELNYQPMTGGKPRCYLSCHMGGQAFEHKLDKNLVYSINGRQINPW